MKKYLSGLLTGMVISATITVFASVPGIKKAEFTDKVSIEVNGAKQNIEVISVVKTGEESARNYVSVGDLAPALGMEANWNGERKVVEIVKKNDTSVQKNNEEWISITELIKYNLTIEAGGNDGLIYIYNKDIQAEPLAKIKSDDPNSTIRIKTIDNRAYINKADLIREGIIKE